MRDPTKFAGWFMSEAYKLSALLGESAEHYGYPE
jgi:hypothetical protein